MNTKTKAAPKTAELAKRKAATKTKVAAKPSTTAKPKVVAKAPAKEKTATKAKAAPKPTTKPKAAPKTKATGAVRNVKKFDAPRSQDFTICDNSGVIGQVRIKPNAVAWKPKRGKAFHQVSLEQLAAFASEHGREVQN